MNPSQPQPPDQREHPRDGLDRFPPNPSNPSRNTPESGDADPMHVSGDPSQCVRELAAPGTTAPVVGPASWATLRRRGRRTRRDGSNQVGVT